jgi:hypothetical protein
MKMTTLASWVLIIASALPAFAQPSIIIDTDFGGPGKALYEVDAAKGLRITGTLPEGWGDNSAWKEKVVADYRPMTEDGRRFVRVEQTSGDGLQFMHDLPALHKEDGYYRITFTGRSVIGISLGIRDQGKPYTMIKEFAPRMTGQWKDFSYDFRLPQRPQPFALFVYLNSNGTLDLQKLRLIKLSEADLIAEIKAKYPQAGTGNLLNQSMFPLGLPSGWSIDRDYSDGDDVQVETDPQVPGPSGSPALRVSATTKGIRLYGAPFAVPWSFETHVVSASVRGDWKGKLQVISGRDFCAEMPLSISGTQWRRIELPFKPVLLAPAHALRLEGKGTLWLDGLQAEHGSKATEYAPQKPLEVSLALPASDAAAARVQFVDEPAKISYAVVGKCPGASLKMRLVNLYGDEKLLPAIKLPDQSLSSGTVAYEPCKGHELGGYRLEAWAEDASGKQVSPFSEIVFYRLRRPRYWGKDAPDSFFGTHTLSTNRHLIMAKAVGCNWVRLHDAGTEYIGWSFLEPEKGKWQFRDADIRRYRDHNLKILGLLSTTPGWAGNLGKPATGYFDRYLEPLSMDDWANAVKTIVSHHRGVIDTYEVWNEPWGGTFWTLKVDPKRSGDDRFIRSETAAADYARLQKVAYASAHEAMPGVTILGYNTYGSAEWTKWTKDILDAGGMETSDAISYHHYEKNLTGFPGDNVEKAYQAAFSPIITKLGKMTKPAWMSEGAPLLGDVSNGFYRYTLPYDNGSDNWWLADGLARYVNGHKANGEAHAFLYTMHGHSTFGGDVEWTTLVTAEGYLHPTAAAHSTVAWLLEDTKFVKRVTLADGVFAYLFAGGDRAVAAVAPKPMHAPYKLPAAEGLQLLDLFGNPMAPGAAVDERASYILCPAGLEKLQSALSSN